MKKQKTNSTLTPKNNRKVFDAVDKIGNGIRKYGPMTAALVVTVITAGKIKPKK